MRYDAGASEKVVHKSAAIGTRSKQDATPVVSCSQSILSLSFESQEIPKCVKDVEMSFGHIYAKGIHRALFSLTCLF